MPATKHVMAPTKSWTSVVTAPVEFHAIGTQLWRWSRGTASRAWSSIASAVLDCTESSVGTFDWTRARVSRVEQWDRCSNEAHGFCAKLPANVGFTIGGIFIGPRQRFMRTLGRIGVEMTDGGLHHPRL